MREIQEITNRTVLQVAEKMVTAAITAPKACGTDDVIVKILTDGDLKLIVNKMCRLYKETKEDYYLDAIALNDCDCMVLFAAKESPIAFGKCGLCGFRDCYEMVKNRANCTMNMVDLGIAMGSAVSIAADNRIDNRILTSAGFAALESGIFDVHVKVCYGIALSASPKNVLFDRAFHEAEVDKIICENRS